MQDQANASNQSLSFNAINALREHLKQQQIDGFILSRSDEFLGEYVPAHSERLEFITGFTGSAGLAIIGLTKSCLFVDGRYDIQAEAEIDPAIMESAPWKPEAIEDFIRKKFSPKAVIGYDPWLFSIGTARKLKDLIEKAGGKLTPLTSNPIDHIWQENRPAPPLGRVKSQPLRYAGRSADEKITQITLLLGKKNADYTIINAPDQLAWLLNIRGDDVPNCPLALSRGILSATGALCWFIAPEKLTGFDQSLLPECVSIMDIDQFQAQLDALFGAPETSKKIRIFLDPTTASDAISQALSAHKQTDILYGDDLILVPRATKHEKEQQGMINAHKHDGMALIQFMHWLKERSLANNLPDELELTDFLYQLRQKQPLFQGNSFDTIAGSGAHGAIVHYRANQNSNRTLQDGELLLLDSGGQYLDGTTDVTRTIAIGTPSNAMITDYTLVLKGHIAIARQKFPNTTKGSQLDILARSAIWNSGNDYAHGTGHGVGSYLNVHEGPQGISAARPNEVHLQSGMVVSNEPGLYRKGHYGIRIENLIMVVPVPNSDMLQFIQLTKAPYDLKLIDPALLSSEECAWVNRYHQSILDLYKDQLDIKDYNWLLTACTPITKL
ncbi:MAG: aminopeptidase P family protein [Alphaproteobacteria bacterium]